jgi:uncharacterized iron-regulated membrane protein
MSLSNVDSLQGAAKSARLYRAIWRWHFYAGLLVAPFLIVLAVTGLIMLYGSAIETHLGLKYPVAGGGERLSLVEQAEAAGAAVPGGSARLFVSPASGDRANLFVVSGDGRDIVVAVDPHDGAVLGAVVKDDTWFYWASMIHGTLMIGDVGDRMIEIAAGLGIVLVVTGLYLWWPRGDRGLGRALVPRLSSGGRLWWKELHATLGFYGAIALLFFFVSGLAWSGIWGTEMTQAWSTFPAEKWDNVPLSDKTHASMNHGALKEVPWGLEQTPLPASGSAAGAAGLPPGTPVNLDTVAAFARSIGFDGQFRVNLPAGEEGVYSISADSMDGDTVTPTEDRTVHLDRYTGKVLADVRFEDYSLMAKAMAVGIALHQGELGWWDTILNTVFCLAVIFMSVSGVVMWWKRRPAGTVGVPLYPRDYRVPLAIMVIGLVVALAFPLTGIAIAVLALIDFLLPKRLKEAGYRAG